MYPNKGIVWPCTSQQNIRVTPSLETHMRGTELQVGKLENAEIWIKKWLILVCWLKMGEIIDFATCDFASSCIWIWISCISISILKHGGTLNSLIYQSRYSTSVCGCLWDWKLTNLQQRRRKTPGDTFTVFTLNNDITVQRDNACFLRWDE